MDLEQQTQFDQMRTNNGIGQCNGGMDEFERFLNAPFQRLYKSMSIFLLVKNHIFRHFEKSVF